MTGSHIVAARFALNFTLLMPQQQQQQKQQYLWPKGKRAFISWSTAAPIAPKAASTRKIEPTKRLAPAFPYHLSLFTLPVPGGH